MSLLSSLLGPSAASPYHNSDDFWYNPVAGKTLSGMHVTSDAAMRISTVYACVRILAETLAIPPFHVFRRLPNGGKERAENHPLYVRLHNEPNEIQTSAEWREMLQGHLALRGNAYCRRLPGPRGSFDEVYIPLHPDRVEPMALPSGRIGYIYSAPDGQREKFTQDDILHFRGLSSDGVRGLSPLDLLRESIGLAMSAEAYAGRYFENNGAPGGYISHSKTLSPTAKEYILQSFKEKHQGVMNAHNPTIFEEGMEWVNVGVDPEKMQMVLTRQYQAIDIARAFRVPLHLVNELTKPSYASIEHQSLEFITYDMMPWFGKWEQRVNMDLIQAKQTFFVEFLLEGLLRGDTVTRYDAYSSAITTGWMSRNEARVRENMNPAAGLDQFLEPLNMSRTSERGAGQNGNGQNGRMAQLLQSASERISRRESAAVQKCLDRAAGDPAKFKDAMLNFYDGHGRFVAEVLCIGEESAANYALCQAKRMCEAADNGTVPHLINEMKANGNEWLLTLTEKEEKDPDAIQGALEENAA